MTGKWRAFLATLTIGALLCVSQASATYNIYAGLTLQIHQDIPDGSLPGGALPNDFHVEGLICTANSVAPVLSSSANGIFPNFSYSLTKLDPGNPMDCWYSFVADWWLNPGDPGIPYCTTMNLGLLFFVEDENTMIDLSGWWTLDGVRVGEIISGYANNGYSPMLGFDIRPTLDGQIARIGNGEFPPIIPPDPIPPFPPFPIPMSITELDVVSMAPGALPPNWFDELYDGGAQGGWPWVGVLDGDGNDINPGNSVPIGIDSFFDIFLGGLPGEDNFTPATQVTINPNDLFFVRLRRDFINNAGVPDPNNGLWQWEIHEAQGPEACCLPDGTCLDITPVDCVEIHGGFPQGFGSVCYPGLCDAETEACCLPDGTCQDETPDDCVNIYGGTPQGFGTTCATIPPTIIQQPQGQDACENDDVTLEVIACGDGLSYQWFRDGLGLGGQINSTLNLFDVRAADIGLYTVTVSNANGPADSDPAFVAVQIKGDSNCDGVLDNFDIDAFVLALTDEAGWNAAYACDFLCANDIDRSGIVDNFDIDSFVTCLTSGSGYCP